VAADQARLAAVRAELDAVLTHCAEGLSSWSGPIVATNAPKRS
jgi:hypothetical protein